MLHSQGVGGIIYNEEPFTLNAVDGLFEGSQWLISMLQ